MTKSNNKAKNNHNNKTPVSLIPDMKAQLIKSTALGAIMVMFVVLGSEVAWAFDLDAGGKAWSVPLIKAFNDFYPVGILIMGAGGTVIAQGDLRAKSYGFGAGCLSGGLMVSAVKAGFGI
jgi:hypothetical protein